MNRSVLFAWACLGVASCTSDVPVDDAECPRSVCSERGSCKYQATYPVCACDPGYTGAVCSRCADGFHRAADDSCVADDVCQPSSCSANGVCFIDDDGATACACALGFGGPTCASCRAGYHEAGDGGCALDEACHDTSCARSGVCSTASGRVSCSCEPGRSGAYCEVGTQSCDGGNTCAATGRCVDRDGLVRCVCEPGFGGPSCDRCAAGFIATDAGCELGTACTPSTCSFAGTCDFDGGTASCTCDEGYQGARCEGCAAGFHRAFDGTCDRDQTCAGSERCSGSGTCREQSGLTVCECFDGYAGVACESCAPGFHREAGPDGGTACSIDRSCRPETCRFHGTCSADGGVTSCVCQPGFSGSHCQNNIDDCANSACGANRCVDLLTSYVCLCDGGVYSQVCP